jgi:uncharacterized integral membrane protein
MKIFIIVMCVINIIINFYFWDWQSPIYLGIFVSLIFLELDLMRRERELKTLSTKSIG